MYVHYQNAKEVPQQSKNETATDTPEKSITQVVDAGGETYDRPLLYYETDLASIKYYTPPADVMSKRRRRKTRRGQQRRRNKKKQKKQRRRQRAAT